jgi:acetyltransferase-like isoleucine patch superfamily enzyme
MDASKPFIHPLADVQSPHIGGGTRIWQFVVVLPQARIGRDGNICAHCFIENDVRVGDRVTLKNGVYLWDGFDVEDDVFIGPNATFTNDLRPRSRRLTAPLLPTRIRRGASIGAGAVILPGLTIGEQAMVGAGAVVTRDVASGETVVGNPARPLRRD